MSGPREAQAALLELNLRRETWCRVEEDGKFWERAERRHFDGHLRNTCDFKTLLAVTPEPRAAWVGRGKKYPQRKHFEESHKAHLV